MDKIISISFGELFLKGKNRKHFVNLAIRNIRANLEGLDIIKSYQEHGKFYVEAAEADFDEAMVRLQKVFGIAHLSPTIRCEKDLDDMKKAVHEYISLYSKEARTFKVAANRADKSFPHKSPELNGIFGGYVLKNFEDLKVDVHNPDLELVVDVRSNHAYVFGEKFPGSGGLPVGSSGKGLSLLSGGIDSPVASYMIGKRGVEVSMVHFNSYPFTSDRSLEKVQTLAEKVAQYIGPHKFYNVNILNIQTAINENCDNRNMTILARRFMMRIGNEIAKREGYQMLITGEALGQVASQTIQGLTATNAVCEIPVMRPLIGMDKDEIIAIAHKIDTYETSIIPHVDSCTVFSSKNPNTKPKVSDLEREEEKLDVEALVNEAIENMELYEIRPQY